MTALFKSYCSMSKESAMQLSSKTLSKQSQAPLGLRFLAAVFAAFTLATARGAAPTDISLASPDIDENNAINAVVGTLSATDIDLGSSFTFALVDTATFPDNNSFNISGSDLRASVK